MRRMVSVIATLAFATTAFAQPTGDRSRAMVPYKIGFENMRAEMWAEAAKSFQQAIDIDATFQLAYYMLGRVRMNQKQYADAVVAFSKARELSLTQAGRQFASAQDRQRARHDDMAQLDEILRQYRLAPQTPATLETIRQLEERKRYLQENINQGDDITVDTSIPVYISLSLGSAYFRSGNMAEAERYYKEAITTDPKAGEAHNNLAVVYLETARPSDAERELAAAEKVGFRVNPQLKADVKSANKKKSE
jgi:tetratricopeptide (TPR) repeat protein